MKFSLRSRLAATVLATTVLATTILAVAVVPASAADLPSTKYAPAAKAYETWSPWMVRLRGIWVKPDSGNVSINGVGNVAKAKDAIVPELDITYFFTPNFAAELILGVTKHDVKLNAGGPKIASTWLLPPTLTLQYHFTNFGAFKPYVGAGVNFTMPFSEKGTAALTNFSMKSALGLAAQVGFDYMIDRHWGINVDVKKLWLRHNWSGNLTGTGPVKGKATLDPWIIGVGVTYKF